jgi:hypothetical protein
MFLFGSDKGANSLNGWLLPQASPAPLRSLLLAHENLLKGMTVIKQLRAHGVRSNSTEDRLRKRISSPFHVESGGTTAKRRAGEPLL